MWHASCCLRFVPSRCRSEAQGRPKRRFQMFKVEDELTESALCVGIIAALIWGVGLSLYGFHQSPGEVAWMTWGVQLLGGILACLIVPLVFVRGREWVLARVQRAIE